MEEFEESIRSELAETPFEELLKIREKLGTKVYRESVLKKLRNSRTKSNDVNQDIDGDEEEEENEDLNDEEEEEDNSMNLNSISKHQQQQRRNKPKNHNFTRENRGFPIESSSKKIDYRYNFSTKPIPILSNNQIKSSKTKSKQQLQEPRDPRFDSNCGEFRQEYFDRNYSFLLKMKQDELDLVRRQLRKVKNEEKRESLQLLSKRLQNQIKTEEAKLVEKQRMQKIVHHKIQEQQQQQIPIQENNSETSLGKHYHRKSPAVFINKPTMKRAQLAEKFKHLKQSGKLDKYLERKRKKNVTKDRKLLHRNI